MDPATTASSVVIMTTQHSQCAHALRAPADDVTSMLAVIGRSDSH